MTATIVGALYIGRKLGFDQNFRFLMASGNAVCGSTAIAATAPVIDADDKDKGISITIVNVTGIFLMFLLPVITGFLYNNNVFTNFGNDRWYYCNCRTSCCQWGYGQ